MTTEVALIILFNHKFEKNVNRLKELYGGRFDHIFFIMPFYRGTDPQVIGVFGNSFFYQGYLAQALPEVRDDRFRHYIVIGDDLILNPAVNQINYTEYFKLGPNTGFIPDVFLLHDDVTPRPLMKTPYYWDWNINAVKFKVRQPGIEVQNELPTYDQALRKLKDHGYAFHTTLKKSQIIKSSPDIAGTASLIEKTKEVVTWIINNMQFSIKSERKMSYPMVGSYSDIVVIPASALDEFIHLSGVFAALQLFVEIAIPTSLLLSVDELVQEKDLAQRGMVLWKSEELSLMEKKYNSSLTALFEDFPSDTLYIHPVKLSRWC
ncbi:hypothetical protein [Arcticibacter sp.]|jgi:hypothetical protein|uniref:hypothetical protein n=1 Tax=Arcticibacter sp. TaxID=1872630 RepID=UPI00388F736D